MSHRGQFFPVAASLVLAVGCTACAFERPAPSLPAAAVRLDGPPKGNVRGTVANYAPSIDYFPEKATLRYAEQVRIDYHLHYKVVEMRLRGVDERLRFILHQRGTPAPPYDPDAVVIPIPLERYALGTFRYAGAAAALGVVEPLVALSNWRNSTTPAIQARVKDGRLPKHMSPELVAARDAEVQFEYYAGLALSRRVDSYAALGVHVVPMAEHLESTPLAKSEWIKIFAAFFNEEAAASALVDAAAGRYEALASEMRRSLTARPRVFVQVSSRDRWNIFGNGNAFAALVKDAGGDYVWADVDSALTVMSRPMELALVRGLDADVWIVGPDYAAGTAVPADFFDRQPFPFLAPIRRNAVFAADRSAGRANPYWDHALYQPDMELADYIHMLHPDRLPDHELKFYRPVPVPPALMNSRDTR